MWLETKILIKEDNEVTLSEEESWEDFMFDTLLIDGFYRYHGGTCIFLQGESFVISESYERIREIVKEEQAEAAYGLN